VSVEHADANDLAAFALGELDEERFAALLAHAASCAACSRAIDLMADLVTVAARPPAHVEPVVDRYRRWRPFLGAAFVLIVLALGVRQWLDRGGRWVALADRSLPKYAAPAAGNEPDFAAAMGAFESREFERLAADLARFLESHAEHADAHFWRGVALRELGKLHQAELELRAAAGLARGPLREHALWVLANTQLLRSRPLDAAESFYLVMSLDGELADRAMDAARRIRTAQ
jgi:hypothetical protein